MIITHLVLSISTANKYQSPDTTGEHDWCTMQVPITKLQCTIQSCLPNSKHCSCMCNILPLNTAWTSMCNIHPPIARTHTSGVQEQNLIIQNWTSQVKFKLGNMIPMDESVNIGLPTLPSEQIKLKLIAHIKRTQKSKLRPNLFGLEAMAEAAVTSCRLATRQHGCWVAVSWGNVWGAPRVRRTW